MRRMDGKVGLITGASRGIGRATAYRLADLGAALYLAADGTAEELDEVARACMRRQGSGATTRTGLHDLADSGEAERMVARALEAFGHIDVLINNAAVRCRKRFGEFSHADFETVVAVNLRASFFASQAVLPAMRAASGGRIIHVASQLGSVAFPEHALYGLSKAALIYLTKAMALELAKEGIQVNAVSPGPIATQYNLDRLANNPELRVRMERYVPLARFGKPDEVAEVIAFLASSKGALIQGHDLVVDGGYTIH